MSDKITKLTINSENNLHRWLQENGISGFDPFDLYSQAPRFRNIVYSHNFIVSRSVSRLFNAANLFAPALTRKIFGVKKTVNAKGVGLLGLGYLYRYKRTKEKSDKSRIHELAEWLMKNKDLKYPGISWGYPFDWQSRIFIPEGTPSVVVSSVVGDFFVKLFELSGEEKYLKVAEGICEFILNGLNQTRKDENTICFSYTPLDNFQVHNANLFGAEFLVRVGTILNNREFVSTGLKAANFAISQQLNDGSLNYWGDDQNDTQPNKNDHYHVGFEIRMLTSIGKVAADDRIISSAEKYYNYYLSNFFQDSQIGKIPKMYPYSTFPLDIHACAEAIILNTEMHRLHENENSLNLAVTIAEWVLSNMQNKDGSFAASRNKFPGFLMNIRIPYLRWGQAWMFYAINLLLYNLTEETHS